MSYELKNGSEYNEHASSPGPKRRSWRAPAAFYRLLRRVGVWLFATTPHIPYLVAIGVGVFGLAWVIATDETSSNPTWTLPATTALAFVLTGVGLAVLHPRRLLHSGKTLIWCGRGCAALVALIGGQALVGWVDINLQNHFLNISRGIFGLISPNAALAFLFLGSALVLLHVETRRGRRPAEFLALAAGLIAITGIVGYIHGVPEFYMLLSYKPMTLTSALTLLVLSYGVLMTYPSRGLMATITADTSGGSMARLLIPIMLTLLPTLDWLKTQGMRLGLWDLGLGSASMTIIGEVVLLGIVLTYAQKLNATAANKVRAEAEIHRHAAQLAVAKALVQKETELTTILDASPAFIWYKDRDDKILRVNKPAAESIGRAAEEIEGRCTGEFYPEEDAKKYHLDDLEVINSGRPNLGIVEPYPLPSGEKRWVRTDKVPYRDGQGNIIGVVVFALDITEHKQAEEALERIVVQERQARLEAERLSRVKDEFLITLSHELRTPLVPILGWIDMLINSSLDQKSTLEALKTIERNAKSELQLIEDLLEISRIITGKLTIESGSVALLQIVKDATQTLRLAAEAKHIDLRLEIDQDPGIVAGDAKRLQQVVWNLLGNALKFTGKGGRITVRVARQESLATIAVTDTGIGIKPDFLPYVFERFRQADNSTTRTFGGLGLGLALVRHISEAHGGTVTAVSPGEGRGATFTVSLPVVAIRLQPCSKTATGENLEDTPSTNPNGSPEAPPGRLAGLKVLIVDDLPDDRSLLLALLMRHGASVMAVGSAKEALEAVVSWQPQVLVSDIGMPNEDGMSLMRRVRELSGEGRNVPAIALTAYGSADDRRKALDAGFHQHLAKPAEPAKLIDAIADLAASSRHASI